MNTMNIPTSALCALDQQVSSGNSCAQSTLEYALVLTVFVVMLVVLGALVKAGLEGKLIKLATAAASHVLTAEGVVDILLY